MAEYRNAKTHLCWVSLMLSVIILNVAMLSVMAPLDHIRYVSVNLH